MPNQYVNKVVTSNGTTLIDLTGDTVTSSDHIMNGYVGHLKDGSQVTGTGQGGGTAAISVVDTADSHGGTVRTITALDISDTTAVASDVAQGKYFYTANGTKTAGTASGGGGATQHTIHLEFSDTTDTDINVYYDDALIGTMITAYIPTTYGNKTVTLAQLDGVTWYEPADIPLNTQLIDYTAVESNMALDMHGQETAEEWYYLSDYTAVDGSMTFSYTTGIWTYIGFYDSSHNALNTIYVYDDGTVDPDDSNIAHGTLTPAKFPAGVAYVRLSSPWYNADYMSLIRTA